MRKPWQDYAEELLADIDKEFSVAYALELQELAVRPSTERIREEASESLGVTRLSLSKDLRKDIGPRWKGPGFCCVVNEAAVKNFLGPGFQDVAPVACIDTALHEAAHAVASTARRNDKPERRVDLAYVTPEVRNEIEMIRCLASLLGRLDDKPHEPDPWVTHEAPFIRALLHIAWRAGQSGYATCPERLFCAGSQYGLSAPDYYAAALGDEPARFSGKPLRSLLDAPPPDAFSALWEADCAAYRARGNNTIQGVAACL